MIYIMSDIHGAYDAYVDMLKAVRFSKNDKLYIVGDIFDGNNKNPSDNIKILDTVMQNDNIHLILGNHEMYHIYYWKFIEKDRAFAMEFRRCLEEKICQGVPLLNYMEQMSKAERDKYIEYLYTQPVTRTIKLGKNYFYLVHGAPIYIEDYDSQQLAAWKLKATSQYLDINDCYMEDILSDPFFRTMDTSDMNVQNTFIVAGHTPTKYYFDDDEALLNQYYKSKKGAEFEKIIFSNHNVVLDCGCRANSLHKSITGWKSDLAIMKIGENGYSVLYHSQLLERN